MAYICLVISCPNTTIADLNARSQFPTKPEESINGAKNILDAINSSCLSASVQITVRDSDPSISTSGAGSTQDSYNKL